jgi:hypothetical protein
LIPSKDMPTNYSALGCSCSERWYARAASYIRAADEEHTHGRVKGVVSAAAGDVLS